MKKYALILASGEGKRMRSRTPKQFRLLRNVPILIHTLQAFHTASDDIDIVLVINEEYRELWNTMISNYKIDIPHAIVIGGSTRFQSVKNGIDYIKSDGLVAVHDGVRPLVSSSIINQSFSMALLNGSAIPNVRLKESIRYINSDTNSTKNLDRNNYRIIQTPQTFRLELLRKSYDYASNKELNFTDDASVFEYAGHSVFLIKGDYDNVKITYPEDLIIADSLLSYKKSSKHR